MSESIIIFGANERICDEYIVEHCLKERYRHLISAYNSEVLQGLNKPDILFLNGWWRRNKSQDILMILETYIFRCNGRVIGMNEFIPPYLSLQYKEWEKWNKLPEKELIESRWEILDIR